MNVKVIENTLFKHRDIDIKIKSLELDIDLLIAIDPKKNNEKIIKLKRKLKGIIYVKSKINEVIEEMNDSEIEILKLKYLSRKPTSLRAMAKAKGIDCRKLIKHNKAILLKVNRLFHGPDLNWGNNKINGKIKFVNTVKPLLEEVTLKETDERLILDDKILCKYFNVNTVNLVKYLNEAGLIVIGKNGKPITNTRINGKTRRCLVIDKIEFNKYI